jgi:hypothetical protein
MTSKTKGNLAYVQASANGSDWSDVGGINKITPKHSGNNIDITEFNRTVVPLYKDRGTCQLDWGLSLGGFWAETDAGQALIIAGLRSLATLYIKLYYDGTHYVSGRMVVNSAGPTPNLDGYVEASFDMDGAGAATFGP